MILLIVKHVRDVSHDWKGKFLQLDRSARIVVRGIEFTSVTI